MIDCLKNAIVYDVELYRNMFMCGMYSIATGKYRHYIIHPDSGRDDREALISMFGGLALNEDESEKSIEDKRILIGYNNRKYDDPVLFHLYNNPKIEVGKLWEWSQKLIDEKNSLLAYKEKSFNLRSIDLSEFSRIGPLPKKLKLIGCSLKHQKLQDLPIDYLSEVTTEQVEELAKYNINDLEITYKILLHEMPRLEMREILGKQYNLDLLSCSDTSIAKQFFQKRYLAKCGSSDFIKLRTYRRDLPFADLIYDYIIFKTP